MIQNCIQNFETGCIEFNKIFIRFENTDIDNGFANPTSIQCQSGAKLNWYQSKINWLLTLHNLGAMNKITILYLQAHFVLYHWFSLPKTKWSTHELNPTFFPHKLFPTICLCFPFFPQIPHLSNKLVLIFLHMKI